ncbi:unnamed protein product, partial [Ectocarpus sp. 12 AP-2014]
MCWLSAVYTAGVVVVVVCVMWRSTVPRLLVVAAPPFVLSSRGIHCRPGRRCSNPIRTHKEAATSTGREGRVTELILAACSKGRLARELTHSRTGFALLCVLVWV